MKYCKKCLYSDNHPLNLIIDSEGVCSGCRIHEEKNQINWKQKEDELEIILESYKNQNESNYDCIIPVSGGKDSYYQAHVITKELNLKPLLVTYHGNNFLPETLNYRIERSIGRGIKTPVQRSGQRLSVCRLCGRLR